MADPSSADPIPPKPNPSTADADDDVDDFNCLPIPPLDPTIFSEYLTFPDSFISDIGAFDDDVEDFDFIFEDLYLPSENEDFLSTLPASLELPDLNPVQISTDWSPNNTRVSNSPAPDSCGFDLGSYELELCQISGDQSWGGARVLNSQVSGDRDSDFAGFLNFPSPKSAGVDRESSQESGAGEFETLLITPASLELPDLNPVQISTDWSPNNTRVSNSPAPDSCGFDLGSYELELCQISGDQSWGGARVLNSQVSGDRDSDFAGFLNFPSPKSAGVDRESSQESGNECSDVARVLNCSSPDSENYDRKISGPASSQGSGNSGSAVSEALNLSPDSGNCARSVASSPNLANNSISGVVDQKIKWEEMSNNCLLKRKKENEDVNSESRTTKYRRSNGGNNANPPSGLNATSEENEKKKARLVRNRESAQLSRQRKKHYVEELEDKVRAMHSTIQDLNTKISHIMAENASLRQQLSGGAMCPPPVPPGAMYSHLPMAPMGYPWMPCPPYVVKPQGSQVPLVPIPRLKPRPPASAPKVQKTEGKTKKVASISFLGLLFFILLFGGLVPMVNVKYGGIQRNVPVGSNFIGNWFYDQHHGKVLRFNSHLNGTNQNIEIGLPNGKFGTGKYFTNNIHHGEGHTGGASEPGSDVFARLGNASEPLVASLYVPRNDKLVKIDGNLIIHSVLASEKAMASGETGLAVARNLAPSIPVPGMNNGRHPHMYRSLTERQRALASGAAEKDNLKSKMADGKLQQWFREGLAGPMLHSGMCTEVFQFDVSPASATGAIIPATSVRNVSAEEHHQNSTNFNKGRNRRILHHLPISLPGSVHNITRKHVGSNSEKGNFGGNNSLSSMVVSVLVDPREAGDSDDDGVMGRKSLSRIFVVVLLDSVKYVTYSCMLPFKASFSHLVTT